jgi:(p)ppGpp synthase/HD superfamily hydrolase
VLGNTAEELTEEQIQPFFDEEQQKEFSLIKEKLRKFEDIGKERRNEDYFGHLDQLNDDYLDVKFADRIDNLRDMEHLSREEIEKKVEETEKYFLHVAEKRNPTAYKLITNEIDHLKKFLENKKDE